MHSQLYQSVHTSSMVHIPLIVGLSPGEYSALFFRFLFLAVESFVRLVVTLILPKPVVDCFYERPDQYSNISCPPPVPHSHGRRQTIESIRTAQDFGDFAPIWGTVQEEHVVLTKMATSWSSSTLYSQRRHLDLLLEASSISLCVSPPWTSHELGGWVCLRIPTVSPFVFVKEGLGCLTWATSVLFHLSFNL